MTGMGRLLNRQVCW